MGLIQIAPCSVEGCGREALRIGMCQNHYSAKARGGLLGVDRRITHILASTRASAKKRGYAAVTTPRAEIVTFAERWIEQGRQCCLCRKAIPEGEEVLDHDHQTGRFRGFLHRLCNMVVGVADAVGDSLVEALADYLRRRGSE
jgi:hypothetical protein